MSMEECCCSFYCNVLLVGELHKRRRRYNRAQHDVIGGHNLAGSRTGAPAACEAAAVVVVVVAVAVVIVN